MTASTGPIPFTGFSADATDFFGELEADNTREFFVANRPRYEREVRTPFLSLVDALDPDDVPAWRVYRPHRDMRFQPDRGPYKNFAGALKVADDGTGRYLMLDRRGLLAASGSPMLARDQLARYRTAVSDETAGSAFVAAVLAVEQAGSQAKPGRFAPLTGTPRGFRADHPRIDYLRWKGVEIPVRIAEVADLDPNDVIARVHEAWERGAELCTWLATNVGPTELSPEQVHGRGRR